MENHTTQIKTYIVALAWTWLVCPLRKHKGCFHPEAGKQWKVSLSFTHTNKHTHFSSCLHNQPEILWFLNTHFIV